ncbi:MAG: diguanylate cyclase [Alphaproteobacteria bacterium]|nr:diguanylate cyclase [Alphaproteobacteria bacterium]MBF0250566.1 diguanylate cyclase [Alphaproteobacteria bacterium]
MNRILVVEDSSFFRNVIVNAFKGMEDVAVTAVETLAEAKRALEASRDDPFFLALLDLNLPDADAGETVELARRYDVPSVVFTGTFNEDLRERFLQDGVLDFVLKDNPSSLDYVTSLVRRIIRNRYVTALVVDDSTVARKLCSDLLRRHKLNVIQAKNGQEALKIIKEQGPVQLVITDNEMPGMDGFELVSAIRKTHSRDKTVVIGLSAGGGAPLSAKFLKFGANDFIAKPFLPEELYTRVSMNLDMMDRVRELTDMATKDFLTGLFNRRSYFEIGGRMVAARKRTNGAIAVAIMDIDHFKSVNDTYGHDTGDDVLRAVSAVIAEHSKRGGDLAARLGGEEFALVLEVEDPKNVEGHLNALREAIAGIRVDTDKGALSVTISIGAVLGGAQDLEELLTEADQNLYAAKNGGRNRVVIS